MSEQNPNVPPGWPAPGREDAPRPPDPGAPQPWGTPAAWTPQPEWGSRPQWNQQPPWGGQAPHGADIPPAGHGPYGQPRYLAPPKPGIVPLRPLMFGEILDGAFQTIRRNAKPMLGAALLAQSLAIVVSAVVATGVITSQAAAGTWLQSLGRDELTTIGLGVAGSVMVIAMLGLLITVVLQGAMVIPVVRSILNLPTGFRQMWRLARPRTGSLLGLAAFQVLAFVAAMAVVALVAFLLVTTMGRSAPLAIIPLVLALLPVLAWLAIRFLVAPAAIVVEELGVFGGLRRSWQLTGKNWWRLFGIMLVVTLLVGLIGQIVQIPISLISGGIAAVVSPHSGNSGDRTLVILVGVAGAVVAGVVAAAGFAFQTSVMALLYTDLRMRKNGLDIDLIRMLETGADPDGVPGRAASPAGPAAGTDWYPPGQGQPPASQ